MKPIDFKISSYRILESCNFFHMLLIFSRSPAFIIQSYLAGHFDFRSRLANTCAYYAFKIAYYMLWSNATHYAQ